MSLVVSTGVRLGILAMTTIACFPRVSLAEAACPCTDGYICCANRCVDAFTACDSPMGGQAISVDAVAKDATTPFAEPERPAVEIQRAVAPDALCQYEADNITQGFGTYDTALSHLLGGTLGYNLGLSYAIHREQEQPTHVSIVGVEGCWYQYAGKVDALGNAGGVVDCATLPDQSGFIPAYQNVEGADRGVLVFQVLTPSMLRSIFGSHHNMAALAANPNNFAGITTHASPVSNGNIYLSSTYGIHLTPPSDPATRDPNWGQGYPTSLNAPVVVQLRAVYTNDDGVKGYSNWFPYLINICPTCLANPCGEDFWAECPAAHCGSSGETCGSGTPLATNPPQQTCGTSAGLGSQTPCAGLIGRLRHSVNYADPVCFPAQGDQFGVSCTIVTDCPTTVY